MWAAYREKVYKVWVGVAIVGEEEVEVGTGDGDGDGGGCIDGDACASSGESRR